MIDGIDPAAERRKRIAEQQQKVWERYTLSEARDHLLNLKAKKCSQRSLDDIVERMGRHLSDWVSRPLATITPADAITRHRKNTADSGPYTANGVFANFRACYNSARCLHRLPVPVHCEECGTPPTRAC